MTVQFKQFQTQELKYAGYLEFLNEEINQLSPFSQKLGEDYKRLQEIAANFKRKIDDFNRKERKLRICIIGQIKAGKSSFLNTLLFNGESILPEASTPKTANLTIIQYGEKNSLEIEYYTANEWQELVRLAALESDNQEIQVAKETIQMVQMQHIDPYEFVGSKPTTKRFNNYIDLLGRLNDYAGDNGKYTPVVKAINLYINNDVLKNIQVVDTPGLNDPIYSRTEKTRQIMEITDVVFYLSMAEKFLDKEDVDLLIRQLPEKGAKRIIVLASKYDSAIIDDSMNRDSLQEVEENLQRRLPLRAEKVFQQRIAELEQRNPNTTVRKKLENSLPPLLISAMTYNLAQKAEKDYSTKERTLLAELNDLWNGFTFTKEDLLRIGNIETVRNKFSLVIDERDQILIEKSKDFIPDTNGELVGLIKDTMGVMEKRIAMLEQDSLEGIKEQQKTILKKKHSIMLEVERLLGGINIQAEHQKIEVLTEARKLIREFNKLTERTGTEYKQRIYEVSAAKLFKPWTWFKTETKSESYTDTYQYLDVSEAVSNVRHYSDEVSNSIEQLFSSLIDVDDLRKSLVNIIIEHFDAGSDNFDPDYFRLLIERNVNSIQFPVIIIDLNEHIQSLTDGLSSEVKNASERSTLLSRLSIAIAKVFELSEDKLVDEIEKFKQQMEQIKGGIVDNLIADIQKEADILEKALANKTEEIEEYKNIVQVLQDKNLKLQQWF